MIGTLAAAALLIGSVGLAYAGCDHRGEIGVRHEDTAQGRFAAYIQRYDDRALLNFGCLDCGFYFAADVLPVNRWFCVLNYGKKQAAADQSRVVSEGRVHFVVTRDHPLEDYVGELDEIGQALDVSGYRLVMQEENYYLYQRAEPGENPGPGGGEQNAQEGRT